MNLEFEKHRPARAFQHVVDQIQEAILEGRIRPGETLPPEMKLKEMFETSRGTVREALRVLEEKGLIEIRTGAGGGAVVTPVEDDKITESLNLFVKSQNLDYSQLAEFREEVEGLVTGLAAERATLAEIAGLVEIRDRVAELIEDGRAGAREVSDLDLDFHVAVAEITGNPLFIAVIRMVHVNLVSAYDWQALGAPEVQLAELAGLDQLIEAIRSGDPEKAALVAKEHVRENSRLVKV